MAGISHSLPCEAVTEPEKGRIEHRSGLDSPLGVAPIARRFKVETTARLVDIIQDSLISLLFRPRFDTISLYSGYVGMSAGRLLSAS
jgi:hypothetical protein